MIDQFHRMAALSLTACAVLLAPASLFAQAAHDDVPLTRPAPAPVPPGLEKAALPIIDVALADGGVVRGHVLTAEGKPVDGAQVVIRHEEKLLHKLITDDQGRFSAEGLRPGVYTIATVQGGGLYRLWPKSIAPPSARSQALLVTREPVVRGQYGTGGLADWISIGVSTASLTVGIIALDKLNDLENDVDALKSP